MNRNKVIKIILILCGSIITSLITLHLEIHDSERYWFVFAPTTVSYVIGSLLQELFRLSYFYEKLFAFIFSIPAWYVPISLLLSLKYPMSKNSYRINMSICILLWIAPFVLNAIAQLNT
jgi:hypothetical protein